ncbi:uncharacterized protein LOC128235425 [Mya arenaria]|uniref:uncharacterized protein LOC128235425 n=1 Tax=Mya arenaria TaxID=6604 RepID=UPI0022E7C593|nr:uncharacterized protein LOC128235425 [Mya arenaria]
MATSLFLGANALLFPLNNGGEPEPELLFACPAPKAPQFGSLKCEYSLFDLKCTATCDNGFQFEDGNHSMMGSCDLFTGNNMPALLKCVRIGILYPTLPLPTVRPSNSGNCLRSLSDCFGLQSGDYAYCDNCRMFATCAGSGFYVRNCPALSVFDAVYDKCVDYSASACKLA